MKWRMPSSLFVSHMRFFDPSGLSCFLDRILPFISFSLTDYTSQCLLVSEYDFDLHTFFTFLCAFFGFGTTHHKD